MAVITRWVDREMGAPVLVAALMVAGALGFEILPDLVSPARSSSALAFALPSRPLVLRSAPIPARAAASRRPAGPMTFNEFLGVAQKAAPKPVAKRFAEAFADEPGLREELLAFQKERGGGAPAHEFLERVMRRPEFATLVSRFRSEPGFQSAFAAVARDARAGDALRSVSIPQERAASSRAAVDSAGKRSVINRAVGPGAQGGLISQKLASAGPAGLGAVAAAPASSAYKTDASGSDAPTRGSDAPTRGSDAATATTKASVPEVGPARVAGTYGSGSLFFSGTRPDGDSCDTRSLFASAPKPLRAALDAQCELGICDPVAACKSAGVLDGCVSVAASSPACSTLLASGAPAGTSTSGGGLADSTVVAPKKPTDDATLHTEPTPTPAATGSGGRTFWQALFEGAGRVVGSAAGFLWGSFWEGGLKGALDGAGPGGDLGARIGRDMIDAVTGFFGKLF